MKAAQLLLAALAMAALLAVPAAAQVPASMSTKGMRYKGYTFSTDVSSLWRLDIDFCQIFVSALATRVPTGAGVVNAAGEQRSPLMDAAAAR